MRSLSKERPKLVSKLSFYPLRTMGTRNIDLNECPENAKKNEKVY